MAEKDEAGKATTDLDAILRLDEEGSFVLRLYVAGMTSRSTAAIASIKRICEELLPGRYDLEVIDIYRRPTRAVEEQVIATPTLIKHGPPPLRRLVGDLSRRERVLAGLGLH